MGGLQQVPDSARDRPLNRWCAKKRRIQHTRVSPLRNAWRGRSGTRIGLLICTSQMQEAPEGKDTNETCITNGGTVSPQWKTDYKCGHSGVGTRTTHENRWGSAF